MPSTAGQMRRQECKSMLILPIGLAAYPSLSAHTNMPKPADWQHGDDVRLVTVAMCCSCVLDAASQTWSKKLLRSAACMHVAPFQAATKWCMNCIAGIQALSE